MLSGAQQRDAQHFGALTKWCPSMWCLDDVMCLGTTKPGTSSPYLPYVIQYED
jgi:hypothetical protein